MDAFPSTPIAGYTETVVQYGSIYVPASLYSAYVSYLYHMRRNTHVFRHVDIIQK